MIIVVLYYIALILSDWKHIGKSLFCQFRLDKSGIFYLNFLANHVKVLKMRVYEKVIFHPRK